MTAVSGTLPAQTAGGATSTTYLGTFEPDDAGGLGVQSLVLTPPAGYSTVTGVATNNVTFTFRQVRAATSLGNIGAVTLVVGTNLVAETPLSVPITASFAVQANDVFDVVMTQNASGLAVGVGVNAKVVIN